MAGEAVPAVPVPAVPVPAAPVVALVPEPADVQAAMGSTLASAAASANAGAELSRRHHGRAQGFRCATNAEDT
jgi:hypothetical protein